MMKTIAVVAFALGLGVLAQPASAGSSRLPSQDPERTFVVTGQVSSPGAYAVKHGMTVEQAIAEAGGIAAKGKKTRIMLTRRAYGQLRTTLVKAGHGVRPGDKIAVVEAKE